MTLLEYLESINPLNEANNVIDKYKVEIEQKESELSDADSN